MELTGKKLWIDYRYEEMEEKAGVTVLPEYDMDGCRFEIHEDDWETNERDDAYIASISRRMERFLFNMDPRDLPF